jgi:O-antigen/teichoic acid export membrane protein
MRNEEPALLASAGSKGLLLVAMSLASFAFAWVASVVFARALGADAFDDYAVAIAAATILATLAELGAGKYAMRVVPAQVERREWSLARGYVRFAVLVIVAASTVVALVVLLGGLIIDGRFLS